MSRRAHQSTVLLERLLANLRVLRVSRSLCSARTTLQHCLCAKFKNPEVEAYNGSTYILGTPSGLETCALEQEIVHIKASGKPFVRIVETLHIKAVSIYLSSFFLEPVCCTTQYSGAGSSVSGPPH